MTSFLWILLLASLVATTIAQDFNLADAFDDDIHHFDLSDAFDLDGFDLSDALGPDTEPKKPVVKPPKGGGTGSGGGSLDDKDLLEVMDGDNGYKPDGAKSGGTHRYCTAMKTPQETEMQTRA